MSPHASALSLSARTRNPTVRSSPRPALPALAGTVLRVLYQHRIATTGQLQQLLTPDAADASYLRRVLRKTTAAGLVDAVRRGSAGHRAWFLTAAGYATVEASGEVEIRAHRMTPALAAGGLLAHRLAVVDVGTAFVTAARRTPGDGCTPWAWAPEVLLQPSKRRGGGGALIADAVLRYERAVDAGVWLATVLIEVDRGTYPVARLGRKMLEYAAWWRTPHRHTHRADRLIVVVDLPTAAAEDRIAMLGALLRQEPATASTTLPIAGVALPALVAAGPWAPVFVDALDETQTPVDLSRISR
jgi:hypothetical protein